MGVGRGWELIDEEVLRLVEIKTKLIMRNPWFREFDRGDLVNTVLIDLWERLQKFDPARGSRASFISHVIDNEFSNIRERLSAQKRGGGRRVASLNEEIEGEDSQAVERGAAISEEDNDRRQGACHASYIEKADMRMDYEIVARSLPPKLKAILPYINLKSPTEISRATGIPRSTVIRYLNQIREHFEKAGYEF